MKIATIDRNKIIRALRAAVDSEKALAMCCSHLAALIGNQRVRMQFQGCVNAACDNTRFLSRRLHELGIRDISPKGSCVFCKIDPESYSFLGALNLGIEVLNVGISSFKRILECAQDEHDKKLFRRIIKEKTSQRNFLRKEKRFISEKEQQHCTISNWCLPEIISKLWK